LEEYALLKVLARTETIAKPAKTSIKGTGTAFVKVIAIGAIRPSRMDKTPATTVGSVPSFFWTYF